MQTLWWLLVKFASRALTPDEQTAVLGDLIERGQPSGDDVLDVTGLAIRRQAALWTGLTPWLGLVCSLPLAVMLSFASRLTADSSSITLWLYFSNWDWALLKQPGFQHDFPRFMAAILAKFLALSVCAWTGGFLLGGLFRRTLLSTAVVLCLLLLGGSTWGVPAVLAYWHSTYPARAPGVNDVVFAGDLYRMYLPWFVQIGFVMLPCIHGLRANRNRPVVAVILAILSLGLPHSFAQEHAAVINAEGTPDKLTVSSARKPAPDFTLSDASGKPLTLSRFRGKVVLLDFWATWCGGCKVELPWYVDFDRKYRGKGFQVIGVSMDDGGMKAIQPFLAAKHIVYPVVMGNDALGKQFGLKSMPLTLLIDRSGKIAVAHDGVVDKTSFERNIQELLRGH